MNTQQIQYVLTLAQERSFSKAAKRLFITQPSLSRYIIALEEQLGCRLFDRSSSPITLTREGELYVSAASRISEIQRTLEENLKESASQEKMPLRLGISPFRAQYYLPLVLGTYHRLYPCSQITIEQGPIGTLKQKLIQGELDLVVGPGPVNEVNLEWERLPDDYIYLALPPDHPGIAGEESALITYGDILSGKAHYAPCVDFKKAADCEFISYSPPAMMGRYLPSFCQSNGFEPNILFDMQNFNTALSIVQKGCGCTLTFETVIRSAGFDRHPLYYRIDAPPWEVVAIWRKGYPHSLVATEFLRILKEAL